MIPTQQQPSLDSPAIEQAPMIQRVTDKAWLTNAKRSNLFSAVVFSYIIAVGSGVLVAIIINMLFGSPSNQALLPGGSTLWKLGIPLSICTSAALGLIVPFFLANSHRLRAMFFTLFLLFLTLIILVVLGLTQLPTEEIFQQILS